MSRVRSPFALTSLLVVSSLLFLAAVGSAAGARKYKGKTSQGQPISFNLSGGKVKALAVKIDERCPDGHVLQEKITFPDMTVDAKGKYGGKFISGGQKNQPTVVSGKITGKKSTGSISDTSMSQREHRLCHGTATFTVTAK